jgi:hypothetical protein
MSLEDIKFWQVVESFFFSAAVQSYGDFAPSMREAILHAQVQNNSL